MCGSRLTRMNMKKTPPAAAIIVDKEVTMFQPVVTLASHGAKC
jgi:hypothetical protein